MPHFSTFEKVKTQPMGILRERGISTEGTAKALQNYRQNMVIFHLKFKHCLTMQWVDIYATSQLPNWTGNGKATHLYTIEYTPVQKN